MQQESSLDEIEGIEDQEIILAVAALSHETVESANQAHGNVPLEPLLQLEELLESGILGQLGEVLLLGRRLSAALVVVVAAAARAVAAGIRKADLGEQTLDLAEALADLGTVVGREVVEGERQE